MFDSIINFIRDLYGREGFIPLHEPRFSEKDKAFVSDCIDSTFVSSVGKYVDEFENRICKYTGSPFAVATVNGTAALHVALILAGVKLGDEVLTQALNFVAAANAITYQGAKPIFLDSGKENLGMCPEALKNFLLEHTEKKDGFCINKKTGAKIKACVPMHVFGHSVDIDKINSICLEYNIIVIEDAAEALGSFSKDRHLGTIAPIGILSFNGNKVITTGGGGMILVKDEILAKRAKHLTTTAKTPHSWHFFHDEVGYNYRLPNLNAALGCSQMEGLEQSIHNKRETAGLYQQFFKNTPYQFMSEPSNCRSNYWLNAIIFKDGMEREAFLNQSHHAGVMTRPVWNLLVSLPEFKDCERDSLENAHYFSDRLVNIPSSVRV